MLIPDAVARPDQETTLPGWVVHLARGRTERQRAHQLLSWPGDDGFEADEVFVLVDPSLGPGEGLGAAVAVGGDEPGERELRQLAVAEGWPRGATGRRLIEEVGNVLRARGVGLLHTTDAAVPDPLPTLLAELGFQRCLPHGQHTLEL